MTSFVRSFMTGGSLTQRVLRSSAFTSGGFVMAQVIRLASNLILTRLLFPEAFGLMAMVSVFMMGLVMFSDVGVGPAIMQSKRGDEDDFLDTAWTIQIIRGFALFIVACILTWPMSLYFGEPDLIYLLPATALTLIIYGFYPTRLETQNRHMRAGRITLIDLATQLISLFVAVVLAWIYQSVWALVLGGIVSALGQLVLLNVYLPGKTNRLRWEKEAASELIHFGKWIFLSTVCGFAIGQADKVIIGGYLSTYSFGIYNIGYFLAAFPLMLGGMVTRRVLIPIYRESPPSASPENFRHLRKMRFAATAALMLFGMALAFVGVWLVGVLYDPRYQAAGGVVVLMAVMQMPAIIVLTYDQAALASGASRRYFVLAAARALLIVGGMIAGLMLWGLPGAIIGQGAALVLAYPVVVWLARREGAWDPLHDASYAALAVVVGGVAIWVNWPSIAALTAMISV
ncbi:oligosaccharide flippase family protein [Flavimaricola marinus]|uniref:Teichuronic acid biosynthesis protein TuaB n=1 Tax=Flavimaricola marinus TaxID=1819565 RepID=A0A238LB80_9RHOB|nr:oligosaccharide flippase family protein [Flavimaricola marinus]SMY06888.1 Teichuronic acid biosynthesis protein TuaB [Flavimaricola marinus]